MVTTAPLATRALHAPRVAQLPTRQHAHSLRMQPLKAAQTLTAVESKKTEKKEGKGQPGYGASEPQTNAAHRNVPVLCAGKAKEDKEEYESPGLSPQQVCGVIHGVGSRNV